MSMDMDSDTDTEIDMDKGMDIVHAQSSGYVLAKTLF